MSLQKSFKDYVCKYVIAFAADNLYGGSNSSFRRCHKVFSLRPAFESCCCGVDNSCMSIHSFSALNLAEHLKSFFPITYSLVNGVTAEAAPHF